MIRRLIPFLLTLVLLVFAPLTPIQHAAASPEVKLGFRTADPGRFLDFPLKFKTVDDISRFPDSPWTHNFLGITGCPGYPALIDYGKWFDDKYYGGNRGSILPGIPDSRVRFKNGNDGLFANAFACYLEHAGTDINARNGTEILAAAWADQVVVTKAGDGSFRIRLRHPNVNGSGQTWYTYYVHATSASYSAGTYTPSGGVSAGTVIGKVGSFHLHFQTDTSGNYRTTEALNPFGIDQAPWSGCLFKDDGYCPKQEEVIPDNCDGGEGVYLYQHADYQGRCFKFTADSPRPDKWSIGNDAASSVKIIGSYRATLYQHVDYQGIATILSGSDPNLGDNEVGHDTVSSLRVEKVLIEDYYTVNASHSGLCMDVYGGSYEAGAKLIQWECHGGSNQAFQFVPAGGDYYKLVVKRSEMCLDVAGGSGNSGSQIIQWPCHGGDNQLFKKEVIGSYYRLVAKHSGQCIDVYGGSKDYGARLIQWPCHNGGNQQWAVTLRPASMIEPIDDPSMGETLQPLAIAAPVKIIEHTLQPDETLGMIAGYYETDVETLLALNPAFNGTDIFPGMTVLVPVSLPNQPEGIRTMLYLPVIKQ